MGEPGDGPFPWLGFVMLLSIVLLVGVLAAVAVEMLRGD